MPIDSYNSNSYSNSDKRITRKIKIDKDGAGVIKHYYFHNSKPILQSIAYHSCEYVKIKIIIIIIHATIKNNYRILFMLGKTMQNGL